MTSQLPTNIALVGSGPEMASLDAALRAQPDLVIDRHESSLVGLNGTAFRLLTRQDVILFRAEPGEGLDLEALRALHRSPERHAVLVALTAPDLPLGEARRLLQAGVSDVLPWDIGRTDLLENLGRWKRTNLPAIYTPPQVHRGRVVTVAQARGGIGASTLAVNLADQLVDRRGFRKVARNRVAVLDLDLQFGSVASLLDAKENDALYQLAVDGSLPEAAEVLHWVAQTKDGLGVLAAPSKFAPLEVLTTAQIGAVIDALTGQYDYVVIDLPRSLVLWISAVLERTDRLMMLTDCTVPAVRQARRLMDLYLENNPALQIEVVMSQEQKPLLRGSHHGEASKLLERPFRHWLPYDPRAVRKANDRGAPLSSAARGSPLGKSIAALARATLVALPRMDAAQPLPR